MKHERYHSNFRYHELVSGNASHETTVVRLELTMSSHRNALRAALKIDPELQEFDFACLARTRLRSMERYTVTGSSPIVKSMSQTVVVGVKICVCVFRAQCTHTHTHTHTHIDLRSIAWCSENVWHLCLRTSGIPSKVRQSKAKQSKTKQ